MARTQLAIKQADITRALRGAIAAGVEIARVEVDPRSGSIVILTRRDGDARTSLYDVWKAANNAR